MNTEIDHDLAVWADVNMLNTVIRNLISNAIKYTHNSGAIHIVASGSDDVVEFVVRDTGVGIDKEVVDKLFKIQHKVSSPGTNNERGTGLGLILCKEFIERHGGRIWLTSEVGKGSAFYFTLPYGDR